MSDLFVEAAGTGEPVILVHGSLATGGEEWQAQQPLAEEFRLLVVDRRGYGRSPRARGEDYLRDAQDIAGLMDGGVHLVGHSYGGLGVMFAAALRPDSTRSLALLEPPAFTLGQDRPAAQDLVARNMEVLDLDLPDGAWLERFLESVGTRPAELPPGLFDAALPMVPLLRYARRSTEAELPLAELASAAYPRLVVSGGHHQGFEDICDDLAARIGATRRVIEGAGHEIQFTGAPLDEALLTLWRTASAP